jgi:hypothetical protein
MKISTLAGYLLGASGAVSLVLAFLGDGQERAFFGFLTVCFLAFASLATIQEEP